MADPFTWAAIIGGIGIGATALGAMTQAAGHEFQGEAQSNQFKYQGQVARINQDIAKQNADYARKIGEVEAQQGGLRARYNIGQTRAAKAAGNLDIGFGSAADVIASMKTVARHDQAIVRSNAARRAYSHEVEAFTESAKGKLYDASAVNAKTAGHIGATGSILGGISSVSSKWMQGSSIGMWG